MTPAAGSAHTERNVSDKILSSKEQGGPAAHDGARTGRTEGLWGIQLTPRATDMPTSMSDVGALCFSISLVT